MRLGTLVLVVLLAGSTSLLHAADVRYRKVLFHVWPAEADVFHHTSSGWNHLGRSGEVLAIPFPVTPEMVESSASIRFTAPGCRPEFRTFRYRELFTGDPDQEPADTVFSEPIRLEPASSFAAAYYSVKEHLTLLAVVLVVAAGAAIWLRLRHAPLKEQLERASSLLELAETGEAAADQRGRVVGGYRLLGRVGAGGMATVYRAARADLERPRPEDDVAVKLIQADMGRDEEFRGRFMREVRLTARLSHPSIVRTLDSGEHEGTLYLVMELIQGRTLRDHLGGHAISVAAALSLLRPICEAVGYAHAQGVVHRDLKPENVMLDEAGRIRVMDFGLAKAQDASGATRLTQSGSALGTPSYMAPEQVIDSGSRPDPRSDQYSLGCMAFEMLAGRVPFEGDPIAVLFKHVSEPVPPLRDAHPEIPQALEAVVRKMLSKTPAERYSGVMEALEAMLQAVSTEA